MASFGKQPAAILTTALKNGLSYNPHTNNDQTSPKKNNNQHTRQPMTFRIYPYLRASTKEQDAERAKNTLIEFAKSKGHSLSVFFIENVSGASLERPKLFEMLNIMQPGDVILIESVDRISRLNREDWETLKSIIMGKHLRIVSLDLPTSHMIFDVNDELTSRIMDGVNSMMLETLAAMARQDYIERRRKQKEGIERAKAKTPEKYLGRKPNKERHKLICELLEAGLSYRRINKLSGASDYLITYCKNTYFDNI
jgi:DNA invertase Pin-like site-specific DNA recombinase